MTNPFTDQWDQPNQPNQPNQQNATPSFTLPVNSTSNQQNIPANSQYTQTFKNVNINHPSNVQQNDQKPNLPLPIRIFNELFSNYEMMICKLFYFLFYSAFGCLFPLIGIYFKVRIIVLDFKIVINFNILF